MWTRMLVLDMKQHCRFLSAQRLSSAGYFIYICIAVDCGIGELGILWCSLILVLALVRVPSCRYDVIRCYLSCCELRPGTAMPITPLLFLPYSPLHARTSLLLYVAEASQMPCSRGPP